MHKLSEIQIKLKNSQEGNWWKVVEKVMVMKFLFGIITGFLEKLGFKIQFNTSESCCLLCLGSC